MATRFQDDSVTVAGTGRYRDVLVRCSDGQWRIKDRQAHQNVIYTTPSDER